MISDEIYSSGVPSAPAVDPSLITYTHVIYGLHALSVVVGLLTTATVVGNFIFGLPSIVAVLMNYARRSAVRGTYLETHFRWQIRTFWFAVLWAIVIAAGSLALLLILVGFVTWIFGALALGVWVIYRVARGWFALRDQRPMYV
jgi:uncharacterized membrane protein